MKHAFPRADAAPGGSYVELVDQRSSGGALRLVGTVAWPADPFFRPTIGVLHRQKLIAVIPTFRRRIEGRRGEAAWGCAFEHALSTDLAEAESLVVCCFETGQILSRKSVREAGLPAPSFSAAQPTFPEGQGARIVESGFPAFLTLPWRKQIDLIYIATLERRADNLGAESYRSSLARGDSSILDIRDMVLRSDEYMKRAARGHWHTRNWLVWPGLNRLPESPFRRIPADPTHSSLELPKSKGLPESLAKIALGDKADAEMMRRWTIEHAPSISAFIESLKTSGGIHHRARTPRLRGLLAAMRPGEAGLRDAAGRDQATIVSKPGGHGLIAFGPYVALKPGNYRAVVTARIDGQAAGVSHLGIEATYKNICLGRADFIGGALNLSSFAIRFSVPRGHADRLAKALFEIKVYWNGPGRMTLNGVSIEPDGADHGPEPVEWLPAMSPVQGAQRVNSFWSVTAPAGVNGNFLHGPHRGLLPGLYVLSCLCDVREAPGDQDQINISIAANKQQPFSRQSYTVSAGGNTLEHIFEIPDEPDGLPSAIEFRISKRASADITVNGLAMKLVESN